jgi:hypothetical protein
MSRWHVRLAELRACRAHESGVVQDVQNVQYPATDRTFEHFEQFEQSAESRTPEFARLVPRKHGEARLEQPCRARRGRVQVLDGAFLHFCVECGRFGAFGYDVRLSAHQMGRWYCTEHRAHGDAR